MKLNVQKKVVSKIIKGSPKRVKFDQARLSEIKEAITKKDLKGLVKDKAISILPKKGVSRSRAKERHAQNRKGRRKGQGSREGKKGAREDKKTTWIRKIRLQRSFIRELKESKQISEKVYRELYMKAKGGFFRSKRHIKLYLANITKK